MTTVLYISAYQYSGSTLTSFLLNTHPKITSLGHTAGWPFDETQDFYCSCGSIIQQCEFYTHLATKFSEHNLPFEYHNFGAAFKLSGSPRLNRYLTAGLPLIENTALELLRDQILNFIPFYKTNLSKQRQANQILFNTAIEFHNAQVYLDNSLDPYRVRHLTRINDLDLRNIHLIRNPRGVAASCLRHRSWPPDLTIKLWLRHQRDIVRICDKLSHNIVVHYDDICTSTNEELAKLHEYAEVDIHPFAGDFKDSVHHILGNQMRLGDGKIKLDTRWKKELSKPQLCSINEQLIQFLSSARNQKYLPLLQRYVN